MDDFTDDTPTRAHETSSAGVASALTAIFGWLMCTLAAGAVAAFAAMLLGIRPCWLILVLALPLTWILKMCGCLYARWSAAVAVLAVLLASFYAACLIAVARIAWITGFSFGQAYLTGGPGLMLQVAELGLNARAVLAYAAAAILAALLAAHLARRG